MSILSCLQNVFTCRKTNPHIVIFVLGLLVSLILYPYYIILYLDLLSLAKVEQFPTVLEQTMCHCIDKNNFSINFAYTWTNIINIIGVKRSVFGSCNGNHVVVKNRLDLGNLKCTELNSRNNITNLDTIREKVKSLLTTNSFSTNLEKFTLCPSLDNVDSFFHYLDIDNNFLRNGSDLLNMANYLRIFYTMQLSMEPIIQQVLTPSIFLRFFY